jgi:hypothetical protein
VTFSKNILPPSSGLKSKASMHRQNLASKQSLCLADCIIGLLLYLEEGAVYSSKTSVNFYQITWCHNPEDRKKKVKLSL